MKYFNAKTDRNFWMKVNSVENCIFLRNADNPDALCGRDLVTLPAISDKCQQVAGVPTSPGAAGYVCYR